MSEPETDFAGRMAYGDYLSLDRILDAQHPLSDAHDELLFIVQHQTSELWLKLALHEMTAAADAIAGDRLDVATKMLARVSRILDQLNGAWDVLRTLTPSDYTKFRSQLGASSGFQSYQYRAIEFAAGNRNAAMLAPHRHRADLVAPLRALLARPSLYDEAIRLLARRGFAVGDERADLAVPREASAAVTAAWAAVYRNAAACWDLYELAEKLVDFEDGFRRWRFSHATTVERIIGAKTGTGGSAGVSYLKRMLDVVLFPELWDARGAL